MSIEPRAIPVAVGEVLAGKYRVERVIGEGGMGVVVAATHLQLDTEVALKFVTHDKGQAVARFLREARSAVRLKSEHVARVLDVGTLDGGMPYMVMEYLEGEDLHGVLSKNGALPIADAVGYVIQASEAVAEAHALGIVHRDIKPHNLFLTRGAFGRPKVKVLDFGISKTTGSDLALTKSTEIVGTPTYMAPEQLRASKNVDARADIWALGAVLYELLTGRLPFEAETLPQLCAMVLSEDPAPPRAHRSEIPLGLDEAILRCLRRAAEQRFADVGELVAALAPYTAEWAPARPVLDAPRSSTADSGKAIISSPSRARPATDAAWSETQLAPGTARRWRTPALAVGVPLAAAVVLFAGVRLGARSVPASGAGSPTLTASQTAEPLVAPPPAPAPASASAAAPAPTASTSAAASSSAPPVSTARPAPGARKPPRAPRSAATAPAQPGSDESEMNYR